MSFLRFLLVLPLGVWIGGLVFLPAVAQISFSELPATHLAGIVVRGSLLTLHWIGFICGGVFLICSLLEGWLLEKRIAFFRPSHLGVVLMLVLTAISQFRIIPRMDELRASAGEISNLALNSPARQQFDFLHVVSTRVEGAVLFLGIILLYLTTRRLTSTGRT